jgi:hypothetical protein
MEARLEGMEARLAVYLGKTFLGVEIIKMLLHNQRVINPDKHANPILIVCYTNHALDQLLVIISDYLKGFSEIVRIGGRSKEERLNCCSLFSFRNYGFKSNVERLKVRSSIKRINNHIKILDDLDRRIFKLVELHPYFSEKMYSSFIRKKCSQRISLTYLFNFWLGIDEIPEDSLDKKDDEDDEEER